MPTLFYSETEYRQLYDQNNQLSLQLQQQMAETQTLAKALAEIWVALGATNQTEAMNAISQANSHKGPRVDR